LTCIDLIGYSFNFYIFYSTQVSVYINPRVNNSDRGLGYNSYVPQP